MHPSLREFIAYSLASAVALASDIALLAMLVGVFHVNYIVAAGASFVAGSFVLYGISVSHVFRFRRVGHRGVEISVFVGLGLMGLLVHLVAMYAAVDLAGLPVLLGKLCAAGCSFTSNFLLRRTFLFTPVPQTRRIA